MDDGRTPRRIAFEAHAVEPVFAGRNAGLAPLQEVLRRHELAAVRQLALCELVVDVLDQIVRRRPRAAGRAERHDRVVGVHARRRRLAVDVVAVRAGVIARQRARVVERGFLHAQRVEDFRLHGGVEGRAQFAFRVDEAPADIAGRRRHEVVVLKHLAEAARRLGRGQQRERRVGGCGPSGVE